MENQYDEFLKVCAERILDGEKKYGPLKADSRNRCQEAIEEVHDAFNYVVPIMLVKYPDIKMHPEWETCVTLIYRLYKALVQLKTVEDELELQSRGVGEA